MSSVPAAGLAISGGRVAAGVGLLATPALFAKVMKVPDDQVTPASKMFAGLFGIRELALAGLTVSSAGLPADKQRRVFLIGAAVDAADGLLCAAIAWRVPSLRRAALGTVPLAVSGVAANLMAARAAAASQ